MNQQDGVNVLPSKPFFIVVEAKRSQALGVDTSRAQLLAQIRALQVSGYQCVKTLQTKNSCFIRWHDLVILAQ